MPPAAVEDSGPGENESEREGGSSLNTCRAEIYHNFSLTNGDASAHRVGRLAAGGRERGRPDGDGGGRLLRGHLQRLRHRRRSASSPTAATAWTRSVVDIREFWRLRSGHDPGPVDWGGRGG